MLAAAFRALVPDAPALPAIGHFHHVMGCAYDTIDRLLCAAANIHVHACTCEETYRSSAVCLAVTQARVLVHAQQQQHERQRRAPSRRGRHVPADPGPRQPRGIPGWPSHARSWAAKATPRAKAKVANDVWLQQMISVAPVQNRNATRRESV